MVLGRRLFVMTSEIAPFKRLKTSTPPLIGTHNGTSTPTKP